MTKLTRRDFMSDQTIRWCPGCGDYSILAQLQTAMATIGLPKEQYAVISGIGCSGRLPYYIDAYGFHTIHGRAPAVATGLKLANPELSVWVGTGDGDALSIGGNHFAHALRRNIDLNIILFNNRIYGLTKGQYSPTSQIGARTKSSPMGSLDRPMNPAAFALGSGATFIARSVDVLPKDLRQVLVDAHHHKGAAFVEVLQNCNIFNDGAFAAWTDKDNRARRICYATAGEPLVWGDDDERYGLVQKGFSLQVTRLGDGVTEADCVVHDPTDEGLAWALAGLIGDDAPLVLGILYQVEAPIYDQQVHDQIVQAQGGLEAEDIHRLLQTSDSFTVRG